MRTPRNAVALATILSTLAIPACATDSATEDRALTQGNNSTSSNTGASGGGCHSITNPNDGTPWPIQVCDDERGRFASTYDRFGVMAVGLPRTNPYQTENGDWFQTFERVEMNSNFGNGCEEGRACIRHLGRWDAERIGGSIGGNYVSCDDGSFAPREDECLPADFKEKFVHDGGREFYGLMISRVQSDCELYPNGERGECFWTERAKVGRRPGEAWVGELLGNKKIDVDFDGAIGDVEAAYDGCGDCQDMSKNPNNGGGGGSPKKLRASIDRKTLCTVLKPLKDLGNVASNAYFLAGAQLMGGVGVTGQVGVEQVWDFGHREVASFLYMGGGLGATFASVGAYMGYALDFGPSMGRAAKGDVIEAWKGPARSLGASVGLLQPWLQGGVTGFASEDWQVRGLVGTLSLALTFDLGVPVPDLQENWYTPSDPLTEAYDNNYWYLPGKSVQQRADGKVVQFKDTKWFALGILAALGKDVGPPVAMTAIAVGTLKSLGTTASQLCP